MRFVKLTIPFATKKYIESKEYGLKIRGNAYYIFDIEKQKFVNEHIEIIEANYRLTDRNMLKTEYYKNPLFKNFRDSILDKFTNHNPAGILKIEHKDLNKEQIRLVNEEFRKLNTTILTMFSCLSGSNPAGAETSNHSSPILCNDSDYFKCNFVNVLKHFRCSKKEKNNNLDYESIVKKDIKSFLEEGVIEGFKEKFHMYNKRLVYKDNMPKDVFFPEIEEKVFYRNDGDVNYSIEEYQKLFILAFINNKLDKEISFRDFKNRLRGFYRSNVSSCLRNKIMSSHSTTEKGNLDAIESAHIIPFSSLVNEKNLSFEKIERAIDPFNCLRIDTQWHTLWDKGAIEFDQYGNILDRNKNIYKRNYLEVDNFPKKTKEYFEEYLKTNGLLKN